MRVLLSVAGSFSRAAAVEKIVALDASHLGIQCSERAWMCLCNSEAHSSTRKGTYPNDLESSNSFTNLSKASSDF